MREQGPKQPPDLSSRRVAAITGDITAPSAHPSASSRCRFSLSRASGEMASHWARCTYAAIRSHVVIRTSGARRRGGRTCMQRPGVRPLPPARVRNGAAGGGGARRPPPPRSPQRSRRPGTCAGAQRRRAECPGPTPPRARRRDTAGISAATANLRRAAAPPRRGRTGGRGRAAEPRPRSTAGTSGTLPRFAAGADFARLLVAGGGIEPVIVAVPVMVTDPGHRESEAVFIAALGNEIEELVRSDQALETTGVRGVGVENIAGFVPVKDADARRLLGAEALPAIVVFHLAGEFLRREVNAEIALEVVPERRDPVEAPAHALPECLDAPHRRAGHGGEGHVAVREMDLRGIEVVGQKRAALAAFLPIGAEHEVIDDELAPAGEQIREGFGAVRAFENVLLFDAFPGQLAALPVELIAAARELLFGGQVREARLAPFLAGNDFVRRLRCGHDGILSGCARAHTYPVCAMWVAGLAAGPAPFSGLLLGVFFNAQQVAGPQLFEAAHPAFVDLPDGHDVQRVDALAPFLARVDQAGVAEHVDVLHDAEAGQMREGLDDRGRGAGALPQQIENCAARGIGQRLPHAVEVVAGGHLRYAALRRRPWHPARSLPGSGSSLSSHPRGGRGR